MQCVPGDSHGLRPRNDMVICRWSFCLAPAVIAAGRRGQCRAPYRKSGDARCPIIRVLLDLRLAVSSTVWLPALPEFKSLRCTPLPDHTCFTRLTTRSIFDSLAPGTAGNQKPSMRTAVRPHVFYSPADEYQLRQFVSGDSPQKSARLCALFFDFVQLDGFTTE